MAASKLVLCDTNILIEFYKGNTVIVEYLRAIGQANIAVSIVTAAELMYGAINKRELQQIQKDITHLQLLHSNESIEQVMLQLMSDYSLSHKLALPDAWIAVLPYTMLYRSTL